MMHDETKTRAEPLNDEERAVYEWQMWTPGFGESGQQRLKAATVLISRVGGLGGVVAQSLAAAGVGRMILAHAGNVRPSDLNRQVLMTHEGIGRPRIESAKRRLQELNPRLQIVGVAENLGPENAQRWVQQADIVIDCAPLFEERFAMNDAAVRMNKPLIECAMYELSATITTVQPGETPCLRCLVPEAPAAWKRRFPVFGAVSGTVGCLAAMEAIKLLSGIGTPLFGRMMMLDLAEASTRTVRIERRANCPVCADLEHGKG